MPLQNSGAISASQIQAEFGGTNPISMSEYYRGGARVPNDVFCHNNTIPANGAISFNDFWNTTNGNRYYDYTSSSTLSLPANTRRAQVWTIAGGGGGCGRVGRNVVRIGWHQAIAGGGGGGYSFQQIAPIQTNGQYITVEVGAGGAAVSSSGGEASGAAGAGGGSVVRVRNAGGAIAASGASSGGGGGGFARVANTSASATGGGGGSGNQNNGGTGGANSRRGGQAFGPVGGGAAGTNFFGDGGSGGTAFATQSTGSATNGIRGRIRIRI